MGEVKSDVFGKLMVTTLLLVKFRMGIAPKTWGKLKSLQNETPYRCTVPRLKRSLSHHKQPLHTNKTLYIKPQARIKKIQLNDESPDENWICIPASGLIILSHASFQHLDLCPH